MRTATTSAAEFLFVSDPSAASLRRLGLSGWPAEARHCVSEEAHRRRPRPLSDFEQAECILVIGQNPGTNHPRMLTSLEAAAKRGCQIISINPLRERGLERFAPPLVFCASPTLVGCTRSATGGQ